VTGEGRDRKRNLGSGAQSSCVDMGPKVTFDSAFLINKSMEVIEASHLFNLRANKLALS